MGFGILLLGYFLMYAFSISQVYFFADIIGAIIVIFAFSKLSQYNRYFVGSMWACLMFIAFAAVSASSLMFDIYDTNGIVAQIIGLLKTASSWAMHIVMFLGIRGISLGAACEKLAKKSLRNLSITSVYYLGCIALSIIALFSTNSEVVTYMNGLMYLYSIVCVVINLILIYNCFGTICPADEDENEVKRSRFAIINKIDDKMDEFEQKNREFHRESMRLAMEEADRRANEKAKHKKPKWKKKK